MITVRDKTKLRGVLKVHAFRPNTDEVVLNYKVRNTITDDAEGILIDLLAQTVGVPSDNRLTELRVGNSTVAPTRADIDLLSPITGGALPISTWNPSYALGTLELQATFPTTATYVGNVSEAGLFTSAGKMFARQAHPQIPKDGTVQINYSWTIAFTA